MDDDKKLEKKSKKVSRQESELLQIELESLRSHLELKADLLKKTDLKYSVLFDENKQLKYDIEVLEREKQKANERLTKLGANVESHSSYIAKQWMDLYKNEWTCAFQELCQQTPEIKCHRGPEKRLMQATEWCYKKCCELSKEQSELIKQPLQAIACHLNFQNPENREENEKNEQVQNTLESLQSFVQQRQLHDVGLFSQLKQKCVRDYMSDHENVLQSELKFVEICCELCYMMRVSDPPMVIEYADLEGTQFDVSKFNQYNLEGTKIEFVVWPDLLLHENGPVLTKGIVRTSAEAQADLNEDALIYDSPKNNLSINKQDSSGIHIFANISDASSGKTVPTIPEKAQKASDDEDDYIPMSQPLDIPESLKSPKSKGYKKHNIVNKKSRTWSPLSVSTSLHKETFTTKSTPSSPTQTLPPKDDFKSLSTENLHKKKEKKKKKKPNTEPKETFISYLVTSTASSTL